jgi:hypothetical protein
MIKIDSLMKLDFNRPIHISVEDDYLKVNYLKKGQSQISQPLLFRINQVVHEKIEQLTQQISNKENDSESKNNIKNTKNNIQNTKELQKLKRLQKSLNRFFKDQIDYMKSDTQNHAQIMPQETASSKEKEILTPSSPIKLTFDEMTKHIHFNGNPISKTERKFLKEYFKQIPHLIGKGIIQAIEAAQQRNLPVFFR